MLDRLASPTGLAPIAFGVKALQRVAALPNGRGDLWSAHVKAVRQGQFCKVFQNILFVESHDTAYVFGIEVPNARPGGLPLDLADKQQQFIQFLRDQTVEDIRALGMLAKVFQGHEYGCEVAAIAAYVVARDVDLNLGVGYRTESPEAFEEAEHRTENLIVDMRFDQTGRSMGECASSDSCNFLAPISCYTCRSFRPWLDGPHQAVLDELIARRDVQISRHGARMASINDRAIVAVAEVIQICSVKRQEVLGD